MQNPIINHHFKGNWARKKEEGVKHPPTKADIINYALKEYR